MVRAWLVFAVVAGAFVGCNERSSDKVGLPPADPLPTVATAAASSAPIGNPTKGRGGLDGKPGPGSSADPQAAVTVPNVGHCVAQCVDKNRMRAVSPEQIDADCKRECEEGCVAHCKAGSPLSQDACKADCEQQSKRVR